MPYQPKIIDHLNWGEEEKEKPTLWLILVLVLILGILAFSVSILFQFFQYDFMQRVMEMEAGQNNEQNTLTPEVLMANHKMQLVILASGTFNLICGLFYIVGSNKRRKWWCYLGMAMGFLGILLVFIPVYEYILTY